MPSLAHLYSAFRPKQMSPERKYEGKQYFISAYRSFILLGHILEAGKRMPAQRRLYLALAKGCVDEKSLATKHVTSHMLSLETLIKVRHLSPNSGEIFVPYASSEETNHVNVIDQLAVDGMNQLTVLYSA